MRSTTPPAIVLLAAVLSFTTPLLAGKGGQRGSGDAVAYSVIPFRPPGVVSTESWVTDLNEAGQAVGQITLEDGSNRGVHLDIISGVYTILTKGTVAYGVNNHNQSVGVIPDGDFDQAAFWSNPSAGAVPLPALAGDEQTVALDINDAGLVVGRSYDAEPFTPTGDFLATTVVWHVTMDGDGNVYVDGPVELPALYADAVESPRRSINELAGSRAQVVGGSGYQAVVWTVELDANGALLAPGSPLLVGTPNAAWSVGMGINNFADVCGRMASASVTWGAPFAAAADQDAQELSVPRGTLDGIACDINDLREIAGSVTVQVKGYKTGPGRDYATLWQNGKAIDLNAQISGQSGWDLARAEAINNAGLIGGWGHFDVYERGFLLIPNP